MTPADRHDSDGPGRHDLDAPGEERDLALFARLAVEPLDEVTRARLVRAALALDEPAPAATRTTRRRAPTLVAVAAAGLAAIVAGVALLVSPSGDSRPTAAHGPTRASPEAVGRPSADAQRAPAFSDTTPRPLTALGDLGDVGSPSAMRRSVSDALESHATPGPASATAPVECALEAASAFGTPIAAGHGTIEGRAVTVVIVERLGGSRRAVTVDATCTAGPSVRL
jgi:hypothetical protein